MAEMGSLPQVWPGWETTGVLGHGSYGTVYEVERRVGKTVERSAVKVISIPKESGEVESLYRQGYDAESITERFRSMKENIEEEYSTMVKLKGCSNVVYCDDIRVEPHQDGMGWDIRIRMELLTPVVDFPPEKTNEEAIVRLAKEMCQALVMCREQNIVHRDVKPQNIFAAKDGTFKLGDFGIAKAVEHTSSGTMTGTYNYMAPEVELHRPYNSTVDIYSLGLVLYWFLNKRRLPFLPLPPEKITVTQELAARERRLQGDALPPPADGSAELKRIVLKACAFEPKDRYQTAAEMLRDLETLTGGTSGSGSSSAESVRRDEEDDGTVSAEDTEGEQFHGQDETVGAGHDGSYTDDETVSADDETVGLGDETRGREKTNGAAHWKKKERKNPAAAFILVSVLALALLIGYFTVHIWAPADCTETRVCRICGKTADPVGHRWQYATFSLSEDYSTVTARRYCLNDPSHVETETAPLTAEIAEAATCVSEGRMIYSATFRNTGFGIYKAEVTIPVSENHSWGDPSYEWSADCGSVTATRICRNDPAHVETETVGTNGMVISRPTMTRAGTTEYTAVFSNAAFARQTRTEQDVPAFLTGYGVGDTFRFGRWEQDGNSANGPEEIEWLILSKEDDCLLVISVSALDSGPYHGERTAVVWEDAAVRKWLNGDFIMQVFSAEERADIVAAELSADPNPTFGTDAGGSTTDRIFLLSIDEAERYFASDAERMCFASAFARQNGAYTSPQLETCEWWLRTPGDDAYYAAVVCSDGSVDPLGTSVAHVGGAIRPAMILRLES